jgi:hypothetical protein
MHFIIKNTVVNGSLPQVGSLLLHEVEHLLDRSPRMIMILQIKILLRLQIEHPKVFIIRFVGSVDMVGSASGGDHQAA